ncbi:hypothetical protein [Maritimibacter sp. UBA3975]|nr:hypothetical protein [Maritimibacter sp. UBA3975]|tara:strand:- start:7168 stop:7293 length:126 start_codon:yes stop_codon:yes gene_type:complete
MTDIIAASALTLTLGLCAIGLMVGIPATAQEAETTEARVTR